MPFIICRRIGVARSSSRAIAAALALALLSAAVASAQESDPRLYRIFLNDGSTLVSYGEFARVADRVVFSMPVGAYSPASTPPLQLVSIAESAVDWTTTERYVMSARAEQYAVARGESDFLALNNRVAQVLNEIALTADPARRLSLARYARDLLSGWGRTSYGYRAAEVAELSGFVDQVLAEILASGIGESMELSFVATVGPPPTMPLLPRPTLKESVEQVLTAASLAGDPVERMQLLQAGIAILDGGSADWSETWAAATRARAVSGLAAETQLEKAYGTLREETLRTADDRAKAADVRGLEALVRDVLSTDGQLGRSRPNTVSALLATLDRRLDAARRLRLARDTWAIEAAAFRAYRRRLNGALATWRRIAPALEDVRSLAGPGTLPAVERQIGVARAALAAVEPPEALKALHAMMRSALQLATSACRLRRDAATRGDMAIAWNASSAAAGSLMLFGRAVEDLDRSLKPPQLQ